MRFFLFSYMWSLQVLLQPEILIKTLGLIGVFGVLFAESGLFFGFFLPGDSLLFTAGVLASQGLINYPLLLVITFAAAVLGDNVGYWFGKRVGVKLFEREDSRFFKKHHLLDAQKFYDKHGKKTIVLARFVPFVRTFAPIVAGAAKMPYTTFMFFNILGGLLWAVGIASLGFFLGNVPIVKHNYEIVIFLIVFGSLLPVAWHFVGSKEQRKNLASQIKKFLK